MFLKQRGDTIAFGTEEVRHDFKVSRVKADHFTADQVNEARDDLLGKYPDDAETVNRYADRLLAMVA